MADTVLPVLADDALVRHVVEVHCARFGCGPTHARPVDWAGLHDSDHRLRYTDGTSPVGHVHDLRAVA